MSGVGLSPGGRGHIVTGATPCLIKYQRRATCARDQGEHQPLTASPSPIEQPYLARRQNWTNQLARHALMQPDATALRFLGHTTTWRELDRRVLALAGEETLRGGGVVALWRVVLNFPHPVLTGLLSHTE